MPAPDFTSQFNTSLTPFQELQFQNWLIRNGKQKDLYDYDLRGAFRDGLTQDPRGHLPDTYKKPNHPTFSNESRYSSQQYPGGEWVQQGDNNWIFKASPWNVQTHGPEALQQYFQQVEPDSKLVFPAPAAPVGGLSGGMLGGGGLLSSPAENPGILYTPRLRQP